MIVCWLIIDQWRSKLEPADATQHTPGISGYSLDPRYRFFIYLFFGRTFGGWFSILATVFPVYTRPPSSPVTNWEIGTVFAMVDIEPRVCTSFRHQQHASLRKEDEGGGGSGCRERTWSKLTSSFWFPLQTGCRCWRSERLLVLQFRLALALHVRHHRVHGRQEEEEQVDAHQRRIVERKVPRVRQRHRELARLLEQRNIAAVPPISVPLDTNTGQHESQR